MFDLWKVKLLCGNLDSSLGLACGLAFRDASEGQCAMFACLVVRPRERKQCAQNSKDHATTTLLLLDDPFRPSKDDAFQHQVRSRSCISSITTDLCASPATMSSPELGAEITKQQLHSTPQATTKPTFDIVAIHAQITCTLRCTLTRLPVVSS